MRVSEFYLYVSAKLTVWSFCPIEIFWNGILHTIPFPQSRVEISSR